MKYFLGGKNITFINRKIIDASANALFVEIVNALNSGDVKSTEKFLSQFINIIKQYAQDKKGEYSEISFSSLESVKSYIDHNLEEKINLEELASIANINKYGFAKKFKFSVGMSPMNYVLMKKIFSSKKTITNYSNLTNIAFDYNFTDMAHFSKTFKRFVGLSPKIYQKSVF